MPKVNGGSTVFPLKIAKIGQKLGNESESSETLTVYNKIQFRLLTRADIVFDIASVPEFGYAVFDGFNEKNEEDVTLWVVLLRNFSLEFWDRDIAAANRLINDFFVMPKKNLFDEDENINVMDDRFDEDAKSVRKPFASLVESLYKCLQDAHAVADIHSNRYTDDHIQHAHLQVQLKPYQVKTIKWMLDREQISNVHANRFVEVKRRSVIQPLDESVNFFYDPNSAILTTDPHASAADVSFPTGGILAEQMGMGKTIEILDLILLNPRPLDGSQLAVAPPKPKKVSSQQKITKLDLKCVCCLSATAHTVECTKCSKRQHRKCVDQVDSELTPDVEYICPACWQSEQRIAAKTTLVVSPQSIKSQWKTETQTRIQKDKLSIFVYAGSKLCKWISPKKLASFDIILTDYETLRSEFLYSSRNTSDRVLRNSSATTKRQSPLLNLNFWRLCLDESQMVVDDKTKHAQVISDLSSVHRWAVTGTPIETSLNDVLGLISFIEYAPYNQRRIWDKIVRYVTSASTFEPLVSILQPIMRRTCKTESTMNEMDVPEQVQQVHYVDLNCLDRYQYNQEREQCRTEFNRLISSFPLDTPLTNLNPATLERIMEPVRTLRRDCSILHVSDGDGNTMVMRPEQMLHHLINTNKSAAKLELKVIASKVKCFVKFCLGKHKMSAAVSNDALKQCRSVLDWAKAYEKEPSMIDSLLQLQTMYHVLLIDKNADSTENTGELKSLVTAFYDSQYNSIIDFNTERQKEIAKFSDAEAYFKANCFQWASAAMSEKKSEVELFNQIKTRTTTSFENVGSVVGTIPGISDALRKWAEELLKQRKVFKRSFDELNTLTADAATKYDKGRHSTGFFLKVLNDAVDCHLTEAVDVDGPSPAKKNRKQCTLCSLNKDLIAYGAFISDTSHKMTKKTGTSGETTNTSFYEYILKVILQSNHFVGNVDTKVGINLLTTLENLRDEFQKYKNLLTSITKMVELFHKVQKRKPLKPTNTYHVDTIRGWCNDIEESKAHYDRKVRVNRYLNCLKENAEVDECAICMSTIHQYIVFECGHQCCEDCFKQILQNRRFECPFCRQIQYGDSTHQFTLDRSAKFTDSSKKIEQIIRKVYELRNMDAQVKILIFSQWSDILSTLKNELLANGISNRFITNGGKSLQKMVDDFKDPLSNVTCLLMPYRYGSRGLNLIEATNVFLVEPIINRGEELQTLGRIHRIGQTRKTCVHRFITKNTIEETIFKVMSTDAAGLLSSEKCTVKTLLDLFADSKS